MSKNAGVAKHVQVGGPGDTPISKGGAKGMLAVQGDQKLIAMGKNIIGRVEGGKDKTDGGIYLPDDQHTQKIFVESIGGDVKLDNKIGRELKVGDQILCMMMSRVPVWDPLSQVTKNIAVFGENDIIAIVE
jgi:co-chaperonin GroES (HSP10)